MTPLDQNSADQPPTNRPRPVNRRLLLLFFVGIQACLLYALTSALLHDEHRTGSGRAVPYFETMKRAYALEHADNIREAIPLYQQAGPQASSVDPELRQRARMAVQNRLAACYSKLGDLSQAAVHFKAAVALGDKKYAPAALKRLQMQTVRHGSQ
jgi:hypothetical protein